MSKGFIQLIAIVIGAVIAIGGVYLGNTTFTGSEPSFGLSTFKSIQVGGSPTDGYVLQTDGTDSTWVATSTLGITGGSGATYFGDLSDVSTSTDATGDIYYLNSSGQITNLGIGSVGEVLKVSGGLPSWGTDNAGGGTFAWTPDTTYGENANSTSTPIWLKDTLYASSTSFFHDQAFFADGTALDPAIAFINGPNEGFYRPTSGAIGFVTGGTEQMRLVSNSLGIGLTNPGSILEVSASVGSGSLETPFKVSSDDTTDGDWFTVINTDDGTPGNVGVGTTSPYAKLSVAGLGVFNNIHATSTNATSTFSGDLRFDGEILPDGLECATGEILKKAGENDWDCATDATGAGGGAFAWTPDTTYGENANSTTTPIWLKDTLYASSTSFFDGLLTFQNATGTQIQITDIFISGDQINDFAGTGLSVVGNALTADLGTSIDISDETNLAVTWPVLITDDTLSWGGLATTSNPTAGNIFYSDGTNGLIPVATSTINVGTATALASNGTNCSAGSGAGGIDASGNAEDCTDYLENIVEDTTPQLGGELDAQGNNIIDLADITFRTGAAGGTIRTGTSNADKFQLQGYDVDDGVYRNVFEVDAGNDVLFEFNQDGADIDLRAESVNDEYALFIDASADNVGIGTSSPYAKLSVVGETVASHFTATTTSTSTLPQLDVTDIQIAGGIDISADFITDFAGTGLTVVGNALTADLGTDIDISEVTFDPILETELDTEAELETQLTDVTNVFTNNDGALNDDDLTDDSITTLSDVDTTGVAVSNILMWNGSNWIDQATSTTMLQDLVTITGQDFLSLSGQQITANAINEDNLNLNAPTNDYILTASSSATGGWEWVATSTARLGLAGTKDLHDAVTLAGTPDYLTISGQVITRGTIDISDDTNLAVNSPITLTDDTLGFDFSTSNTWTGHNIFSSLFATNASSTNATTTNFHITGLSQVPLYADANGLIGSAGSGTSGNCIQWGANNTLADAGSACGSGGGTSAWTIDGANGLIYNATTTDNVGVGTSSPYARLSVWGTDPFTGADIFQVVDNASTTIFSVNDNGYVGVNTISPSAKLEITVDNDEGVTGLILNQNDVANSPQGIDIINASTGTELDLERTDAGAQGPQFNIYHNSASPAISDNIFTFYGRGEDSIGATTLYGQYDLQITNPADGSETADWIFDLIGAGNFQLLPDGAGNVGVGTSSPYAKLSVVGETVASHFTATTTATSTMPQLDVTDIQIAGGIDISGDFITDFAGTGLTVVGGALTADLGTSIDISDETNLAVTSPIVLTDDTLSFDGGVNDLNNYDWTFDTTFNDVALTATTSESLWVKGNLYASSTQYIGGYSGTGLIFDDLGTGTIGIDFSGSGLSGGTDYFIYKSAFDYWRADGFLAISNGFVVGGNQIVTSTGYIAANTGSVSVPGYRFLGDTDVGIYRPAVNNLGLVAGGVEALRVDSSQRVGIGTSSPYANLTVWDTTANTGALSFEIANSASTTLFSVNDIGNATTTGYLAIEGTGTSTIATGVYFEDILEFEGITADAFETIFKVIDPTQDNTIALPDGDGIVALADFPMDCAVPSTNNAAITTDTSGNRTAADGFAFDPTTDEELVCSTRLPNWVNGTETFTVNVGGYATGSAGSCTGASESAMFNVASKNPAEGESIAGAWSTAESDQALVVSCAATFHVSDTMDEVQFTLNNETAVGGDYLYVRIIRNADDGADTFDLDMFVPESTIRLSITE